MDPEYVKAALADYTNAEQQAYENAENAAPTDWWTQITILMIGDFIDTQQAGERARTAARNLFTGLIQDQDGAYAVFAGNHLGDGQDDRTRHHRQKTAWSQRAAELTFVAHQMCGPADQLPNGISHEPRVVVAALRCAAISRSAHRQDYMTIARTYAERALRILFETEHVGASVAARDAISQTLGVGAAVPVYSAAIERALGSRTPPFRQDAHLMRVLDLVPVLQNNDAVVRNVAHWILDWSMHNGGWFGHQQNFQHLNASQGRLRSLLSDVLAQMCRTASPAMKLSFAAAYTFYTVPVVDGEAIAWPEAPPGVPAEIVLAALTQRVRALATTTAHHAKVEVSQDHLAGSPIPQLLLQIPRSSLAGDPLRQLTVELAMTTDQASEGYAESVQVAHCGCTRLDVQIMPRMHGAYHADLAGELGTVVRDIIANIGPAIEHLAVRLGAHQYDYVDFYDTGLLCKYRRNRSSRVFHIKYATFEGQVYLSANTHDPVVDVDMGDDGLGGIVIELIRDQGTDAAAHTPNITEQVVDLQIPPAQSDSA
jgi:hypothetical protein